MKDSVHVSNAQCSICVSLTYLPLAESQLNAFLHSWTNKEYDGVKILSPAAHTEVECLRKHIKKGCLSGKHLHLTERCSVTYIYE